MGTIHKKALLVQCRIRKWDGAVRDGVASTELKKRNGMHNDSGVFTKFLLSKSVLKPIEDLAIRIRRFHNSMTIPYSLEGVGVLPTAKLFAYRQGMTKHKESYEQAVQTLIDHYDFHVSDSKLRLGSRYDPAEFPTADELRSHFSVDTVLMPIPSSDHLLIDLTESGYDKADVDKAVEQAVDKANQRLWSALHNRLCEIKPILDDPARRYMASHRDKLGEFIDKINEFNFADSDNVKAIVSFIRDKIVIHDLDAVRHDPKIRSYVAAKVSEAIATCKPYIGASHDQAKEESEH